MKALPTALADHLATGTTTIAHCWKLTRIDGVVMGFTDHDRPLMFAGVTFEPDAGFTASEMRSELGLNVDSVDVKGALSSARITEADLLAGLYDNAGIEVYRANWQDPTARILIRVGSLGEIRRGRQAFEAEVRSLAHLFNQPKTRTYQYQCDADLGDARCGVDLTAAAYRGVGTVSALVNDRTVTATGLGAFAGDLFSRGRLVWSTGGNAGRPFEVRSHALVGGTVNLELWRPPSSAIVAGDTFVVTAGCDKSFTRCKLFANAANFRGFPDMPGNDVVSQFV